MPRKTRKQKLRAAKRTHSIGTNTMPVKREFEFSFEASDLGTTDFPNFKKNDNSFYSQSNRFVVRDLIRTIILAVGILAFEIMIYWSWFK